ncbi:MFS transporter [candidate division KSB1 bacterium]|nr:MFS transporter [candidate division KSB1 bacterium]RQW03432.1 MAG: MFS transporter [candidate division KSB1 bacterium]
MSSPLESSRREPTRLYRWIVLVFISLAMFGNYYIYDSIGPIADILKSDLGFSDRNIGSLNSVYSIAAIFILLIGGVVIDKYGTKKSVLFFGSLCTLAAFVTMSSSRLSVMLTGRVLLGLGAEPLIVAITTALAKWFKGKELSFAFGINLTIARLGSVAADTSPRWAQTFYTDWQHPLMIAAVLSIFCVIGGLIYFFLESYSEKHHTLGRAAERDKLVLGDLFKFNTSFWFIVALCVTFYSAIFPFRTFAIKFFQEAHGVSREVAGPLNSVLPLSALIVTPFFGLLVDKIGKRAHLMMLGSVLLIPVYLMLVYTDISLYIPIALMGISFSLIPAVMWPSVAYIVEENRLGTAYALMTLIQQIGLAGFNWLIGFANDYSNAGPANPEGYRPGMWIFSVLGFLGLFFAFMLQKADQKHGGHLASPHGN